MEELGNKRQLDNSSEPSHHPQERGDDSHFLPSPVVWMSGSQRALSVCVVVSE